MSYNISRWKTKKLDNFRFAYQAAWDIANGVKDVSLPIVEGRERDEFTWELCENGEIIGSVGVDQDTTVVVDVISCAGMWSGNCYEEVLKPLFAASMGELQAIVVWEDGDEVVELTVLDGQVTTKSLLE